jgi:hypothetical protein
MMISFLKESTFVVNDVLSDAWEVLKKRYFAIAGLCFLMFVTSNSSAVLGFYFNDFNSVLNVFIALLFVVLYFGIQLTLFKHIFQVLDKEEKAVKLKESIPSIKEMGFFFAGMLIMLFLVLFSYLLISVLLLPLIYLEIPIEVLVNIGIVIACLFIFLMLTRLAFFPFFIIDKGQNTFRSLRLSLAITRGNVTKLLMLLAFFVILNLMYLYFSYLNLAIISTGLSLVNSFLVIPLASVTIAIAYRKMMGEYHGSEDPEVFKNIL